MAEEIEDLKRQLREGSIDSGNTVGLKKFDAMGQSMDLVDGKRMFQSPFLWLVFVFI